MREDPFNGTWKLNVAASKLPFTPPQSVVLHIEADQDWVTLTENSIASEGGTETVTIRAQFNNQVYPVYGSALADGFAVQRVDALTWKTRGLKAGEIVFAATLGLTQDGGSFREDGETTLVGGTRAVMTLVYERYKEE